MKLTFLILLASVATAYTQQVSEDAYTRYELLDPASQSFRILYEVTATRPGSQFYFNALRQGSMHRVDAVVDMMTGKKLEWSIVNGAEAMLAGYNEADNNTDYLKIKLARPVPVGGEYRLKIDKTYQDPKSYISEGDKINFKRSLGIKRNSVVLPAGYELIACNYPSQVVMEKDGRLKVSFINPGADEINFMIEARKLPSTANLVFQSQPAQEAAPGQGRDKSKARLAYNFPERAYQTREIVYFLQQPETHSFRLYHDYTETREGMDRYINVVRAGSKASNPSAKILDTGKDLKVETLKGDAILQKKIDIGEPVTPETEAVVIWFDPVQKGQSVRLRIEETYTDPNRYLLSGNELVWDRSFGRPSNVLILPEGWFLTANAIPAVITTEDNKVSLLFVNGAPDEIDVFVKARKR